MSFRLRLKIVGIFLLFFLVIATLQPSYAQAPSKPISNSASTTTQQQNTETIYGNVDKSVPRNMHTLSQSVLIETLSSVVCALSGRDPINPKGKCLTFNPQTGKIAYATSESSVGKFMGGLIAGTASIPVSGTDYVAYSMDNFGLVKHTYAANQQKTGSGYARLAPLIGIWVRFRDLAYLFFVLAFTIVGLAIMFRVKIDARTVMTIQNQIPKIVIALVLVTFSYAIAGFLIDLMYVITYFIIYTFSSLTPTHVNVDASVFGVFNKAFSTNASVPIDTTIPTGISYNVGGSGILNLTYSVSQGVNSVLTTLSTDFIDSTIGHWFSILFTPFGVLDIACNSLGWVTSKITFGLFDKPSCDFAQEFFKQTVQLIFGVLAFIIVLVAIFYTLFRVWFTLVKSFAYVLVDSMIGPLWIAAGIFPGSKLGFSSWVRHLMGHLSVFPATFAVIFLGKTMMDAVAGSPSQLFSPPLVGGAIGGNPAIAGFIGFGFIISLPTILDRTKKAVGAMDFGLVDIKKATGVGIGVPRGSISTLTTAWTPGHNITEAPGLWRTLGKKV